MKQAIVAVEDKRFYEHNGVDVRGIGRALWQDIRSQGLVEGGSTITQQFVKNAYVRNERTIARKVREAALAWQLEQRWSKERILTAYLNTIYFGNGAYGILQAARAYFGKKAIELTLPEAALLAGIPTDPSRYDPVQHPAAAHARRSLRARSSWRSRGRSRTASAAWPSARRCRDPRTCASRAPASLAPYFVNYVKDQLVAKFGADRVFGGGLEVTTTIDLKLQEQASRGDRERARATRTGRPRRSSRSTRAPARCGRWSAARTSARASSTSPRRRSASPGSAFKPIVLASAFRRGISPLTRFDSKPVVIDAGDRFWRVTNYESSYLGRDRPDTRHGLLRQLGLRAADRARRPAGDRGDRARARRAQRAARVLLDRARRRGREPARHGAGVRDDRQRRHAGRRRR